MFATREKLYLTEGDGLNLPRVYIDPNHLAPYAWNGDETLKEKMVGVAQWHAEQDRFLQGRWLTFNGAMLRFCSVGCTLSAVSPVKAPADIGLAAVFHSEDNIQEVDVLLFGAGPRDPVGAAHLQEAVFEALPPDDAISWTERFFRAVPVGSDLRGVGWPILERIIQSNEFPAFEVPGEKEASAEARRAMLSAIVDRSAAGLVDAMDQASYRLKDSDSARTVETMLEHALRLVRWEEVKDKDVAASFAAISAISGASARPGHVGRRAAQAYAEIVLSEVAKAPLHPDSPQAREKEDA